MELELVEAGEAQVASVGFQTGLFDVGLAVIMQVGSREPKVNNVDIVVQEDVSL